MVAMLDNITSDGTIVYRTIDMVARDCGNKKVGSDTITTSRAQDSCPPTCPLMGSGCYGENVASAGGRTLFQNVARKNGKSLRGIVDKCLRRGKAPRAMRFNVVGDYLDSMQRPDMQYINETNDAADALKPLGTVSWSYTHAWKDYGIRPDMFRYTVRASCQTFDEVTEAHAMGWTAAVVVPTAEDVQPETFIDGRKVVVCPVITGKAASCADCRLCGRNVAVIAFPIHGVKKARAIAKIRSMMGK